MNIHRIKNYLTLTLSDSTVLSTNNCTDEMFNQVVQLYMDNNTAALYNLFYPEGFENLELKSRINKSNFMTLKNNSIYIESISQLTVPTDFAEKLIKAEEEGDKTKIDTYLNFWTLVSLNPDSRVRNNIFWFINKWDIKLTKSGLIIAYRNADIHSEGKKFNQDLTELVTKSYYEKKNSKKDSPDKYIIISNNGRYYLKDFDYRLNKDDLYLGELNDLYNLLVKADSFASTTYTDHHSHTFRIKLGHIVQMPREECDPIQENTCSSGLHCASKGWLEQNYFGNVGMRVLVNPADVVAVP